LFFAVVADGALAFWTEEQVTAIREFSHRAAVATDCDGPGGVTILQFSRFSGHPCLPKLGRDGVFMDRLLLPEVDLESAEGFQVRLGGRLRS
jgi:hypothetical protein